LIFILGPGQLGGKGEPPPAFIGWIFVIVASLLIVSGFVVAALVFTAGRFLAKRKHHTFCLVIAAVECLFMPFGTVLGVFTIIVLLRPTVRQLFGEDGISKASAS
jgi:nitrate reductase gamma subunit